MTELVVEVTLHYLQIPLDASSNGTWKHRSQELKEMLPEGVLSTAIRADFCQPQKNDRNAELIKYWR